MEIEDVLAPSESIQFTEKARVESDTLPGTLACTDRRLIFLKGTKRGYSDYRFKDIEHISVHKDGWLSKPFQLAGAAYVAGVVLLVQNMPMIGLAAVAIGAIASAIGIAIRGEELCIRTTNAQKTFRVYTTDAAEDAAGFIRGTTTQKEPQATI